MEEVEAVRQIEDTDLQLLRHFWRSGDGPPSRFVCIAIIAEKNYLVFATS